MKSGRILGAKMEADLKNHRKEDAAS